MGASKTIKNRIENVLVNSYIRSGKRIRSRTDGLIPKARSGGKAAKGFVERRAAVGRKQVMGPIRNDLRSIVGLKPKKRRKRRKKR